MLKRRKGSVFAFAISLTAVFLTMIVATMAYFESASKQANSEKWRDVAEQAARSGLDLVIGWGEATLDRYSKLPADWELKDGQVIDPVSTYGQSQGIVLPLFTSANAVIAANGNPAGSRLGAQTSEYVVGRVGNYIVTFKARLQQFRMSEDAPRQYRIGVTGRVRKGSPGNGQPVDSDERRDIVAERFLIATLGKEPFSRYAALIDIDAVKNWVPGELVQGPVHVNRGYVDILTPNNWQPGTANFDDHRSQMKIHTANGTGGFKQVNGRNNPVFLDRVSMTASNNGGTMGADDNTTNITPANLRYGSFLRVNDTNAGERAPGNASGLLGQVFTHPDNIGAMNGINGPVIEPSPVPFPPSSKQRVHTALGLPPGVVPNDVVWFRLRNPGNVSNFNATMHDGLYMPTVEWTSNQANQAFGALNYGVGAAYPAGGIYIRGNVEEMRMTVNGPFSYYMFQLGYGSWRDNPLATVRRVYAVKVNRQTQQVTLRAFPRAMLYGSNSIANRAPSATSGTINDAWRNPDALRNYLNAAGGNPEQFFTGTMTGGATPQPQALQWAVDQNTNLLLNMAPMQNGYAQFPFNGVIFVDASRSDPMNLVRNADNTVQAGVPITGNIYALGDKEPGNISRKLPLFGQRMERVATNNEPVPANTVPAASKLTIVTAGHIFIQNSVMLEALRTLPGTGGGTNPLTDAVTLANTRDLIGLVADRQVVFGLAAPSAARGQPGVVVHAAIAALRDPDSSYRKNVPAYWGSFTTEGLQPLFNGGVNEYYQVVDYKGVAVGALPGAALPVAPATFVAGHRFNANAANPGEKGMPGTPIYAASQYLNMVGKTGVNPNRVNRGNMIVFGSVTQFKRGAVGAGNNSYDKDFRYDKRLMTIAPPVFPTSTRIGLRVSAMMAPGDLPYGPNATSPTNRDLNFMGIGAAACPTTPPQ